MEKLDFKKINIRTDENPIEPLNLDCISPDDADTLAMEEPKEDENSLSYILAHGTKIEFMNID
jgi:hypothetical protein